MNRFRLTLSLLFWCMAFSVHADGIADLPETDQSEIKAVIQQQLYAIERSDADAAFYYASPAIQEAFGTSARFLFMVRRSYSALYRPRHTEFLNPTVIDGNTVQPIQLVAEDGTVEVALFEMQRQEDNQWKINGCDITESLLKSI
jgi:Domain of unknown function (DUF4864)